MTKLPSPLPAFCLIAVAVLCCIVTGPAVGEEPRSPMHKQAVRKQCSPQRTLALYAKDPDTWKIRPSGAQGTLIYNVKSGRFIFTARKLKPHRGYVLVRNADTPPTGDLLALGTTNKAGQLRLDGRWHDWTKKIWLVSRDDLTLNGQRVTLIAWNPEQYLFEEKVLVAHGGEFDG